MHDVGFVVVVQPPDRPHALGNEEFAYQNVGFHCKVLPSLCGPKEFQRRDRIVSANGANAGLLVAQKVLLFKCSHCDFTRSYLAWSPLIQTEAKEATFKILSIA